MLGKASVETGQLGLESLARNNKTAKHLASPAQAIIHQAVIQQATIPVGAIQTCLYDANQTPGTTHYASSTPLHTSPNTAWASCPCVLPISFSTALKT